MLGLRHKMLLQRRSFHASAARSLLVRSLDGLLADGKVTNVDSVESRRYLTRDDGLGFSLQHEIISKGTPLRLHMKNHVQAMYVILGEGSLEIHSAVHHSHALSPGTCIAIDEQEDFSIVASSAELHVLSVTNPPLVGDEGPDSDRVIPAIDTQGNAYAEYSQAIVDRLFRPPTSLKGGSAPMKDHPLF
ncbi:hypothetical protein SDRG_09148 [Saprolegnia diclina VS20]|uniref:L-ectoine synthase n=1 Tax=Saprolegnia diclina (strain VS20) TaxID=1156394 RepID=T0RSK5_SAPDV|nr:hypothetical protein SDRG_09148 [Saprolegnia diclina VS20]EQC33162.1 hypothetical protein SDRG_09148 [Saprolegnia diclina VS20]|eukprot:XP_008613285.1 hypothetical protein SDRG_09148 [Saprolegnia diclina VS20]